MDMVSKYYCYVLLDPRKSGKFEYTGVDVCFLYEPFYVGKGSGNRIIRHFTCEKTKRDNRLKDSKVKAIINSTGQVPPHEIILYDDQESKILEVERFVIESIGRMDLRTGPLLNLQEGGGQPPKFNDFNDEKKESIRQKLRNKKQTQETKDKRAAKLKGKKRSVEFCIKLSQMRMGKGNPAYGTKHSKVHKEKIARALINNANSKQTYQYTLDGKFIMQWPSMGEIERQLGFSKSKICACCKGRKATAYGFIWKSEPTS